MVLSHGHLRYAPQAAIKSGLSSTDAIDERFGIVSDHSNLTDAGNPQGAALWIDLSTKPRITMALTLRALL